MSTAKTTKATKAKKIIGTVFGGPLNVRAGENIKTEVVSVLPIGTEVEILKAGDVWHKIKAGYVLAKWINVIED